MGNSRQQRRRSIRKSSTDTRQACRVEAVEGRVLFATITVNSLSDDTTSDAVMTLREAVELMDNAGDSTAALSRPLTTGEQVQVNSTDAFGTNNRIVFDSLIAGGTLSLGSALSLSGVMTIDGGDGMTLAGGGTGAGYRAMNINGTADVSVRRLTVTDFGGVSNGGAFYVNPNSSLSIALSTILSNKATGTSAGSSGSTPANAGHAQGGAIFTSGDLSISDTTFDGNIAEGGIAVTSGSGNATAGNALGGAVYGIGGNVTIVRSTFVNNQALGGDAIISGGAVATGGTAHGGAIYIDNGGTADIVNSTVAINSSVRGDALGFGSLNDGSSFGGGVMADSGTLNLDFITASGNVADDARNIGISNGSLTMNNSIAGQSDNSQVDVAAVSATVTGENNLVRNTALTNELDVVSSADPLLAVLADNGGPTKTLSLQPGSPAFDAADVTVLTADQRGRIRVVGSAADLGAVEANPSPEITNAASTTFTAGIAGSFTFTTVTDGAMSTLSQLGTLPAGVTFTDNADGTATLAGTPAAGTGGIYALNITAANGASPDGAQTFTLTVNQAPAVNVAATPSGYVGSALNLNVTTTGYPTASTISLGGDALPTGVTFHDNGNGTATISGTPAGGTTGVYNLTVTAANGVSPNGQANVILTITDPPPQVAPGVTVAPTASVEVGAALDIDVTSTGFPVPALSLVGTLPAGVTFTDFGDGTGVFNGTPAAGSAGTYNVTVTASNGVNPDATGNLAITITDESAPTLVIEEQTLGASGNGKRVEDIGLSFGKPLATTPPMGAFTLFGRDGRQLPANRRSIALRGVTYDAATQSVSVQPMKSLRNNRFFVLNADSSAIEADGGGMLDGAGDGTPGSAFQLRFGRGKRLTYIDSDGDRVTLRLRGPGVMELTRDADGEGLALKVAGATEATRLSGKVTATKAGGDGTTTFASFSGLEEDGGVNELDPDQFNLPDM